MAADGTDGIGRLGAEVLAALDFAALERRANGVFELLEPAPVWFAVSGSASLARGGAALPPPHPFLAHFLEEVVAHWEGGGHGGLDSGVWTEADPAGLESHFRAIAVVLPGPRRLLLVQHLADFARERLAPLQAARDAALDRVRWMREVEKKEFLLHCIVHDLMGPLSGMLGTMSLLQRGGLDADRTGELAELGIRQARKQESMIRSILEVFSLEVSRLEAFVETGSPAPDLSSGTFEAVELFRPAFTRRGVRLELEGGGLGPLRVRAEADRLERVLGNLLENALRHAPAGSTARVTLEADPHWARCTVEDQGSGVPDSLRGQLFEKFVRDPASGGVAGLGLYSCRRNVERWGGRIGYEPRPAGGSRFWFELARVPPATGG